MSTFRIVIPQWQPSRLNDLMKCHWGRKTRLRKADDDMVAYYARMESVPPATGPRRVSLEVTLTPRQRADRDCWWKSVLDALVNCRLLVNDEATWCDLGAVTVTKGDVRQTVIVLEDIQAKEVVA